MIGTYQVDEQGRTYGFSVDGEAGSFGEDLHAGQLVSIDSDGEGVIANIYTRIHTGESGQSNYVCVDILPR